MTGPTARQRLTAALRDLAADGGRPPCWRDPEQWFHDSRGERARAAEECATCPVLEPCDDAANETREKWGVWAGVDHTPKPKRKEVST